MKRLVAAWFLFVSGLFATAAHAGPLAYFELTCTNCANGGTFSRSWTTPFDATTAPGYEESLPGFFFKIEIPTLGGTFYAHSASYPNGYNYYDSVQVAMAGSTSSLIFDGPTSAPVWKVGEYDDVVNYFNQLPDQGQAHLSITAVPEPASLALVGLGLFSAAAVRRRKAQPA